MRVVAVLILAVAVSGAGAILAFNMGLFHTQLESQVVQATGANVKLGRTRLLYRWPLKLEIGPSLMDHAKATVRWSRLDVEIVGVTAPYWLRIHILEPKVTIKEASAQTPDDAVKAPQGKSRATPIRHPASACSGPSSRAWQSARHLPAWAGQFS